ncbi:MAG: DNA methylase, partial [Candidatus Odinarchaeota archaeon]
IEFDEARKLAYSIGINLEKEWNKGFIRKSGAYINLIGPTKRKIDNLEDSVEVIDLLHYILLLWEKGDKKTINEILLKNIEVNEIIFRTAQAISQSLPNSSKEKKLIDGFLTGKEKIKEIMKELKLQKKIDRWAK